LGKLSATGHLSEAALLLCAGLCELSGRVAAELRSTRSAKGGTLSALLELRIESFYAALLEATELCDGLRSTADLHR
jgi:hypothetical protein